MYENRKKIMEQFSKRRGHFVEKGFVKQGFENLNETLKVTSTKHQKYGLKHIVQSINVFLNISEAFNRKLKEEEMKQQ
jgi:hypothetical protein